MITLIFFENGKRIAAYDTELEPEIATTCIVKGKQYQVDSVRFVFESNCSYLRLDVTGQQESKED
jgi:hypothetical protein